MASSFSKYLQTHQKTTKKQQKSPRISLSRARMPPRSCNRLASELPSRPSGLAGDRKSERAGEDTRPRSSSWTATKVLPPLSRAWLRLAVACGP